MDSKINETKINEINDRIQTIVTEQTGICSTIARQIGFGLTAATWLLFKEGSSYNIFLLLAIICEILYFTIDFMQYLFLSINYKKVFYNIEFVLQKIEGSPITEEKLLASIQLAQQKANNVSYKFFNWKFPFIVASFFMIFLFAISKM